MFSVFWKVEKNPTSWITSRMGIRKRVEMYYALKVSFFPSKVCLILINSEALITKKTNIKAAVVNYFETYMR